MARNLFLLVVLLFVASLFPSIRNSVRAQTLVEDEAIDPLLARPASGAIWDIPVLVVRILPTLDGRSIDHIETGGWAESLADTKARIDDFTVWTKFMLEEGSRFRGYADAQARPSLGYRVVGIKSVYEPFSQGKEVPWNPDHYFPDYHRLLGLADAERFVNNLGVREIWIWGYHSNRFEQPESNMSSPLTGDISNSSRFEDDLPLYGSTYTLYGYNYNRTQAEAVHNHGHQLEAILSHAATGQDGTDALFWRDFVGRSGAEFLPGRCGWTHMPPNTTDHYDYEDPALVETDCEDWTPTGTGSRVSVNNAYMASLPYTWPARGRTIPQLAESQFYIWWMQNMPGANSGIRVGAGQASNWWQFTGDWDGAIGRGSGLHEPLGSFSVEDPGIDRANLLSLSPNPASRELLVAISGRWDSGWNLSVYDVLGRRVAEHLLTQPGPFRLAIEGLPPGHYLVRAISSQGQLSAHFVRQ